MLLRKRPFKRLLLTAALTLVLASAIIQSDFFALLSARTAAGYLERATGASLAIENGGGPIWRRLELSGIRITGLKGASASIGKLEFNYDLAALLRGRGLRSSLILKDLKVDAKPLPGHGNAGTGKEAAPQSLPFPVQCSVRFEEAELRLEENGKARELGRVIFLEADCSLRQEADGLSGELASLAGLVEAAGLPSMKLSMPEAKLKCGTEIRVPVIKAEAEGASLTAADAFLNGDTVSYGASLTAEISPGFLPESPFSRALSGNTAISLKISGVGNKSDFNGRVSGNVGCIAVKGGLALGAVPRADIFFESDRLDLSGVMPETFPLPLLFSGNSSLRIEGAGMEDFSGEISLRYSGGRAGLVGIKDGGMDASFEKGRWGVREAWLSAGLCAIRASGSGNLAPACGTAELILSMTAPENPAMLPAGFSPGALGGNVHLSFRDGSTLLCSSESPSLPGAVLREGLRIHLYSDDFDLGLIGDRLPSGMGLRRIKGRVSVEAEGLLGGKEESDLHGKLTLSGLGAFVEATGTDIGLDGSVTILPGMRLNGSFLATSGGGNIQLSVNAGFSGDGGWEMDASCAARGWPLAERRDLSAEISGLITLSGNNHFLLLSGELAVPRMLLRPELSYLENQRVSRDPTVRVLEGSRGASEGTADALLRALSVTRADVGLSLGPEALIRHENASLNLRGGIRISGRPPAEPVLSGNVEVDRGWFSFQGRRFIVERGRLYFTGGAGVDPRLDIAARSQTISDHTILLVAGGTASAPELKLRSDPLLPQSDIFSLLIFGRTSAGLEKDERGRLDSRMKSLSADMGVSMLSRSLLKGTAAEAYGIEVQELDSGGGLIEVGRHLSPDTRVSVGQGVGDRFGRIFSIEHRLRPCWKLITSRNDRGGGSLDLMWTREY